MGRYNGNAGGAGGALQVINAAITAAQAVQRGDLVLMGADSKGYPAAYPNDSALDQFLRPTAGSGEVANRTTGMDATTASTPMASGSGVDIYDVVKLTNGRILVAYPSGATGFPSFTIYDQDANVLVGSRAVANAGVSVIGNVSAAALPNGGFAICYFGAINQAWSVYLAIYDADGNQTVPPFKVYTSAATVYAVRMARLANGNIVVAMKINNAAYFAIYKTDGTQVIAATLVASNDAASQGDRSIGVASLVGGGFVIAYILATSGGAAYAWARQYDNSGTAFTQAGVSLSTNTGNNPIGFVYPVALAGGGYAIGAVVASGTVFLTIFNSAGAIMAQRNLGALKNTINGNFMSVAAAPNGNVGIAWIGTGTGAAGLMVAVYGANGAIIASPTLVQAEVSGSSTFDSGGSLTFGDDNTAFACATIGSRATVFVLTSQLSLITSWASPYGGASYARHVALGGTSPQANLPSYFLAAQGSSGAINVHANVIKRQAMTLVGVATNSAAKDAQVGLQLTGLATLRRPFPQTWATNQQNATPPGQRAYAIGTTAVLSGIQSATPSPIN